MEAVRGPLSVQVLLEAQESALQTFLVVQVNYPRSLLLPGQFLVDLERLRAFPAV